MELMAQVCEFKLAETGPNRKKSIIDGLLLSQHGSEVDHERKKG